MVALVAKTGPVQRRVKLVSFCSPKEHWPAPWVSARRRRRQLKRSRAAEGAEVAQQTDTCCVRPERVGERAADSDKLTRAGE